MVRPRADSELIESSEASALDSGDPCGCAFGLLKRRSGDSCDPCGSAFGLLKRRSGLWDSPTKRSRSVGKSSSREAGFTLVELLVVMAIITLLLGLALPRYFHVIDGSKETVLVENLRITRDAIDKFYGDTGRYPDSLDELVEKRYLRAVPFDPVADSASAWTIVPPQEGIAGNVYDLHSSAEGAGRDGRAFVDK